MKLMKLLLVLSGLLFAASAFADTTWVASGNVSGVWAASGSPYVVHTGDITVATGDALLIEAGVRVYFAGNFKLVVHGLLQAIGTESDSIWFTGDPSGFPYDSPTRWRGLRFVDAHADCELRYCSITYSGATGAGVLSYGGGLYCYNTDLEIARSRIHHCHAGGSPANAGGGCGAYFEQSEIELAYTEFKHNGATVFGDGYVYNTKGGGFAALNATIHLRHCVIQSNRPGIVIGGVHLREGTVATFDTCLIDNNQTPDGGLGGVMAEPTSVVSLTGTTISNHHPAFGFDGGMRCVGAALTMDACTLKNNSATWIGPNETGGSSGLGIFDPVAAVIANSVFDGNHGQFGAASLCENTTFTNCTFRNNNSSDGAVFSNGGNRFSGCVFEGNVASSWGPNLGNYGNGVGGAIVFFSGTDTVSQCKFDGNTSYLVWEEEGTEEWDTLSTVGAALYCQEAASPYIVNSVFVGNNLNQGIQFGTGSVMYCAGGSPTFEFCTMDDNSASGHPGGVIFMDGGALTMNSCIVSNSTASCAIFFDQGANGDIDYCDFFGISGVNFRGVPPTGLGAISTTNVNGDPCDQYFNIYLDPQYVDAVNGNLHLMGASPCVDAADPVSSVLSDFDGNARPNGAYADMGAFEYSRAAVTDLVIFADVANGDAVLYWSAVAGASGYEIYRGDTQDYDPGNSVLIGTTTATTFTDDDVLLAATEQRTYVVVVVMP